MNDERDLTVRRARPDEAELVVGLINSVWPGNIRERRPWLFTPRRMPDHLLCESGEELWGVAGIYPYDVRLSGVTFRMAGIGQVITRPERRGRGVMTVLLSKALGDLREQGYDAAWLLGDRLRYNHFGFVPGGRNVRYVTNVRYLPPAPAAESVHALDPVGELDRVHRAFVEQPGAALLPADEMALVFKGFGVRGWAVGGAFALFSRSGDRMLLASGRAEEVALLLAHQAAANARQEGGPRDITFDAPYAPCMLSELGRSVYRTFAVEHSADFRILSLRSFLKKAAQSVAGRVPDGTDALSLRDTDTGEAVTLKASNGAIRVLTARGSRAAALSTLQLGEAVFDWLPTAARPPDLAADSPLRVLFPFDFHLPWISAVLV